MKTPSVISTTLPTDAVAWPEWLEHQLVRGDLGQLVCELEAILGVDPAETPDVRLLLGKDFERMLKSGLSVLSPEQVSTLVKHPRMLLRLQEAVLIQGGDYWSRVDEADDTKSAVVRGWKAIELQIAEPAAPKQAAAPVSNAPVKRRSFLRILSTVAAVLAIGVTTWLVRPVPPTWGFDQSGLLTSNVEAPVYLNSLADAANDWFKKRPEDSEGLAKRLRDFRHGCDTLIQAPHSQLAADDKAWLVERCQAWAEKIDGHLADLQSGAKDVQSVRAEADETIHKLVSALKQRSAATA